MSTIRSRLTAAYTFALLGTMAVFGVALYVARRIAVQTELQREANVLADQAVAAILEAAASGDVITTARDTAGTPQVVIPSRELLRRFERWPEYLILLADDRRALLTSSAVQRLTLDDRADLQINGANFSADGRVHQLRLGADEVFVVVRTHPTLPPGIWRVVVGVSVRPSEVAPRELMGTMLLLGPIVILLSIGSAYLIAGRAFRPVDLLINEVEAITDGRSLHRRLPVAETGDELARLTATLNAMMGRLETSFAALRRFTADASHELKTPLAVLRADVERAMSSGASSTEQLIALEEALQETARMTDLVDSLLTLARADEGRFDIHREPVAMGPLVGEVLETANILGEDAGLTVEMPVATDATVMGDRTRLRQLLLNLVTNAIKYTPRGGRVELSLVRKDDVVVFTVRDTGVGIAAADLPHIFERFYRADRARSRSAERGGFGLGLAICHWIVQAHGGHIAATSRLGRGSTFTVTLPVRADSPAPTDEPAASADSTLPATRTTARA